MKAKRRQELKTNDLAAWIEEAGKSFSQWGVYVIGGVAVVVLIAVIGLFMNRAKADAETRAFADLTSAVKAVNASGTAVDDDARRSLETIDDLIAASSSDDFKRSALLRKASIAMYMARNASEDTAGAEASRQVAQYLADARAAFETIVEQYQDHALHYGRALFGLFQVEAFEFVLDEKPTHRAKAEEYLGKIRDDARLNGTPFQMAAASYLNDLANVFTVTHFPKRPELPASEAPAAGAVLPGATTTTPLDLKPVVIPPSAASDADAPAAVETDEGVETDEAVEADEPAVDGDENAEEVPAAVTPPDAGAPGE